MIKWLKLTGGPKSVNKNSYLHAKQTIQAAERAGLSVCDYVEREWGQEGCTEEVVSELLHCGVFASSEPHVLEIGTGTGRYLEKVLQVCSPSRYESYEVDTDWARWLQDNYPIASCHADGVSLESTASCSVNVLLAHGLFVYLPFLTSCRYFNEIFRVCSDDAWVVFDVLSEDCFDPDTLSLWLDSGHDYPCFISTDFVETLFARQGLTLVASFMAVYGPGRSKYLVFRRGDAEPVK